MPKLESVHSSDAQGKTRCNFAKIGLTHFTRQKWKYCQCERSPVFVWSPTLQHFGLNSNLHAGCYTGALQYYAARCLAGCVSLEARIAKCIQAIQIDLSMECKSRTSHFTIGLKCLFHVSSSPSSRQIHLYSCIQGFATLKG